MLSPKIETERLILRRYKESDIDAIYEIITDGRLATYIKFPNLTKEEELECIREWIREEDFYEEIKNTFNTDISKELFNNDYLIKILDEHKNREKDNYRKIWAVYSFLKWYDEYFVKR